MRIGCSLSHLPAPTPPGLGGKDKSTIIDESCFSIPVCECPIVFDSEAGDKSVSFINRGSISSDDQELRRSEFCQPRASEATFRSQTTVPQRLEHARRQGQLRLRRLRGPSLLLGTCCLVIGSILAFSPIRLESPVLSSLMWFLGCLGMVLLLFSLVPTDVRCVPVIGAVLFIPLNIMVAVYYVWELALYIEMLKSSSCYFLEDDDHDVVCSVVALEASGGIFVVLGTSAIACYLVWCFWSRLNTPVLLWSFWRVISIVFFFVAVNDTIRCVARFISGSINSRIKLLLNTTVDLLFFVLTARYRLIVQFQSWLMSRGQAATVAAGVAELLGGKEPESVLAHARQTFSCILASQVTFEDMLENKPNASLGKKVSRAHLGHIDAFVSHSWHDDPVLKWTSFQSWCEEFKKIHRGREPTLWIDKYCIDQNNIEESLACLPIYLSGCKTLLILCGPTYLSRLWCVIEIFVFLEMGGKLENLEIRFIEKNPSQISAGSVLSYLPQSSGDSPGKSPGKSPTRSPWRARCKSKSFSDAATLGTILQFFDSRNASCFTEEDTLRLHGVLEMAGADKVNALVNKVFAEKLIEARSEKVLR